MRGHIGAVGILALLLIPNSLALEGTPKERDFSDSGAAATRDLGAALQPERRADANDLVVYAPAGAFRDHLVHLAVAVPDPESASGLRAHQDLSIIVQLNGNTVYQTHAVHEHDGFHPFTITPHEAGSLVVWADHGDGHEAANAPNHDASAHNNSTLPDGGIRTTIPVTEAPAHRVAGKAPYRFPFQWLQPEKPAFNLDSQHHGWVYSAQFDIFGPDGRLFLSLAPDMLNHNLIVGFPTDKLTGTARVFATSAPSDNLTIFSQQLERTFAGTREDTAAITGPSLLYPDCVAAGLFIVDPNSATEAGLTFGLDTDIRLAAIPTTNPPNDPHGPGGPTRLLAVRQITNMGFDGPLRLYSHLLIGDPFSQTTFRVPDPGTYEIFLAYPVGEEFEHCATLFTVLPNIYAGAPGELITDLEIDETAGTASITLSAQHADGLLPHYEFDTRLVLLDSNETPGRFVWKGKLHGHEGVASFSVAGLNTGTYEVQVFPSPQDPGTPPLYATDPRGFVTAFQVERPAPTEAPPPENVAPTPAPTPILLIGILLALGMAARRNRRIQG